MVYFFKNYGTNYFSYKKYNDDDNQIGNTKQIEIPEGNYTQEDLIKAINDELDASDLHITFTYKDKSNKVLVETKNDINWGSIAYYNIEWASNEKLSECFGGSSGQKIDYNLGWLLGYREIETTIRGEYQKLLPACVDVTGPRYLLLSIDDYTNNKPNQDLISTKHARETYKIPSYWNRLTMDPGCEKTDEAIITSINKNSQNILIDITLKLYNDETRNAVLSELRNMDGSEINEDDLVVNKQIKIVQRPKRHCYANPIDRDDASNLTKQKYTVDQIKLAINGAYNVDRYESPNSRDIFARIPIQSTQQDPLSIIVYK